MATKQKEYDLEGFAEAKKLSITLMTGESDLNQMRDQVDIAFFMEDTVKRTDPDVKLTVSPDLHNKVEGGVRLLTATGPSWNVPADKNDPETAQVSSVIEQMANTMWDRSNSIQQRTVERELAMMGLLYDEMHVQIISTKDVVDRLAGSKPPAGAKPSEVALYEAELENAKDTAARTPFLFEPLFIRATGWKKDRTGLASYYNEVSKNVAQVKAEWGGRAMEILGGKSDSMPVVCCSYWNRAMRYVWLKEAADLPLCAEAHGLHFIPIGVDVPYGSLLFDKVARQRMPFLFPAITSGIWNRQTLLLTAAFTNVAALANAQFAFNQGKDDDQISIDNQTIGGVVVVPPGGRLTPMSKQIIPPELVDLLSMAKGMVDESTIQAQALGAPLGANAAFSMVALLAQAGRLPLTPIQRGMARLCANLMELTFRWLRTDKKIGTVKMSVKDAGNARALQSAELKREQIPTRIEFDCTVDVKLPQDKLQMANTGVAMTQGDDPLTSKEYVRTNILGIGQSDKEQEQIWFEKFSNAMAGAVFQKFMQESMGGPNGGPGGGPPQPGGPGQVPPEGAPVPPGGPAQLPPGEMPPGGETGPVNPNGPVTPIGMPQVNAGPVPEVLPPGMNGGGQ